MQVIFVYRFETILLNIHYGGEKADLSVEFKAETG